MVISNNVSTYPLCHLCKYCATGFLFNTLPEGHHFGIFILLGAILLGNNTPLRFELAGLLLADGSVSLFLPLTVVVVVTWVRDF